MTNCTPKDQLQKKEGPWPTLPSRTENTNTPVSGVSVEAGTTKQGKDIAIKDKKSETIEAETNKTQ